MSNQKPGFSQIDYDDDTKILTVICKNKSVHELIVSDNLTRLVISNYVCNLSKSSQTLLWIVITAIRSCLPKEEFCYNELERMLLVLKPSGGSNASGTVKPLRVKM